MANKTAVNWLEDQLKKRKDGADMYQFCIGIDELQAFIDAAKIVERQQILAAAYHGANYESSPYKDAEDYYNKTYKSE
jgi:hypothetical protein